MRRIFGIAWRVLRTNFAEPKVYVPMLLLPLAFTFVFGVLMFGSSGSGENAEPARLALCFTSREQSALAQTLRDELGRSSVIAVTDVTEDEARSQVKAGDVIAGVVVPAGFADALLSGDHPGITLIRQDQSNLYVTAAGEVERTVDRVASAIVAADLVSPDRSTPAWQTAFAATLAKWHEPGRDVAVLPVTKPVVNSLVSQGNMSAIGFCIMFVMLSVMVSAGVVLEERTAGTWRRLLATPARKFEIVLGYIAGFFINGWVQMGILVLATRLLFGVSWGDPLGFFVLTSLFILASTAIGVAVAGIVKTAQQQSAVANIAVVVTSMVAGTYWPYEMMPRFMQRIGTFMPQYWALRGYKELLLRGGDLVALGLPLLVLGGITVVLLAFGVSRVRFE